MSLKPIKSDSRSVCEEGKGWRSRGGKTLTHPVCVYFSHLFLVPRISSNLTSCHFPELRSPPSLSPSPLLPVFGLVLFTICAVPEHTTLLGFTIGAGLEGWQTHKEERLSPVLAEKEPEGGYYGSAEIPLHYIRSDTQAKK